MVVWHVQKPLPTTDILFEQHYMMIRGFPSGSDGKESTCNAGDLGLIVGLGSSPGEEMATCSSIVAWQILRTEELGRLWASLMTQTVKNLPAR